MIIIFIKGSLKQRHSSRHRLLRRNAFRPNTRVHILLSLPDGDLGLRSKLATKRGGSWNKEFHTCRSKSERSFWGHRVLVFETSLNSEDIIIIIIITISFMQGIYTHIPETNPVPKEYNVAAILSLLFMVPISLAAALTLMYFYISTFRRICAVPNMAVFCSSLTSHYYYYYYYYSY
jgi:hypothetical protein